MSYVVPRRGVGLAAFGAFGAIDFNGSAVWSDWQAGGSRGTNAAKAIQAALNQIGYGPITVDGDFGNASMAAWQKFASANGVNGDWPDQVGILKLGDQVAQGGNQGGGQVVNYNVENGQYVPSSSSGSSNADMSMLLGVGVAALVGIGILALISKKKKAQGPASGASSRSSAGEMA